MNKHWQGFAEGCGRLDVEVQTEAFPFKTGISLSSQNTYNKVSPGRTIINYFGCTELAVTGGVLTPHCIGTKDIG